MPRKWFPPFFQKYVVANWKVICISTLFRVVRFLLVMGHQGPLFCTLLYREKAEPPENVLLLLVLVVHVSCGYIMYILHLHLVVPNA